MNSSSNKGRIGWIDLAKGICIFLVVFHHATVALDLDYPFSTQLTSFRMPLYFILSGLFFKQYEGFIGFLKRKTNKLLIPFLFFLLMTSVIPCGFIQHELSLKYFFTDMNGPLYNYTIWFLLCLFEINLLFYFIQWLAGIVGSKYTLLLLALACVSLGVCGLFLGLTGHTIPLYVGTTLTALPFFAFGWWLRRHTRFLSSPVNLRHDVPLMLICGIIVFFCATPVIFSFNFIPREGVAFVHLCGIAGTMMVLILAKILKRIPLVTFWGRYSIMILCTHEVVILVLSKIMSRFLHGIPLLIAVLTVTLLICHLLILFMRKYMPHVTAQKDLIPV